MKTSNSDCQLFAINKREPIRISWHGSEECFTRNKGHLLNALGNGVLSWKREGKSQNLPFNLRFAPLLVSFNSDTSICSNSRTNSEFAFIHIFFVNSANSEEYRLTVRPEISEWFATLNEANESHWVILFDSSKVSKDKKAKSQLMDKLKSDFSRFQNRIFEFAELTNEKSFSAFSVFLQSTLFASFEIHIANLNAKALKLKGSLKESSFELHSLVNEQFRLCRFYWNLGLFEVALAELDILANFFSDSIKIWSANENIETWPQCVRQLRLLPLGRNCILLGVQMYHNTVEEELSLVKFHAHLLAHQFLLLAQNLHNRLSLASVPPPVGRSLSQPSSPQTKQKTDDKELTEEGKSVGETEPGQKEQQLNTLQLRHNAVTAVLRYAREAICRFEQHIFLLRANQNAAIFHSLLLVWLAELFGFCEHLLGRGKASQLCDVSSATAHLNFLLLKKCEAIRYISAVILRGGLSSDTSAHKQCLTVLRRWFDATSPNFPSADSAKSSSSTSELQQRQHFALADESVRLFRDIAQIICVTIDGEGDTKAFEHFAKFALSEALESFGRFGWWRNAFLVRQQLAELIIGSSPSEAHALFRRSLCVSLGRPLVGSLAQRTFENLVKHFEETADKTETHFKTILFGCCLAVLSTIDQSEHSQIQIEQWHSKMSELARERKVAEEAKESAVFLPWPSVWVSLPLSPSMDSNSLPIPLSVVHVRRPPFASSPFVLCSSNRWPFSLIVGLQNSLAIPLNDCQVKARFMPFSVLCSSSNGISNSFLITASEEKGGPFTLERLPIKNKVPLENCDEFFEIHQTQPKNVTLGAKSAADCTLTLQKVEVNGYFFLDSIFVSNTEFGIEFVLNYQDEMAKNDKLENVFCCVIGIRPNIQMKTCIDCTEKEKCAGDVVEDHSLFVSGIEQHFWVSVSPGTASLTAPSHLMVQSSHGAIEFLNSDGDWANEAQFPIPPLGAEGNYRILVRMFKGIDHLVAHQSQHKDEGQREDKSELKFEWLSASDCASSQSDGVLIARRSFPITFRPIMLLSWRTSFLADRTLFNLDISRKEFGVSSSPGAFAVDVLPTSVSLSSSFGTDCELLNPSPFKPIVPNSIFRFIWRLPEQSTEKSDTLLHLLQFNYHILAENAGVCQHLDGREREHSVSHRIGFPLQKIDYELCARFFSEQSQSVFCRVDQPTDLVVSLRSLSKTLSEAETLIVSIGFDNDSNSNGNYWHCAERHKLARVKENGIGQAIFTVVPRQLGFLPFPPISLHRPNGFDQSPSRNSLLLSEKCFGERLLVFYRNLASQIHIIGPLNGISDETASISSANTTESAEPKKKSLKTVAKDRLQKLFE